MRPALRYLIFIAIFSAALIAAEEAKPERKDETSIRKVFITAYQTAETAEAKVALLDSLKGLKEKESLRLIAGMLGDRSDIVRKGACSLMVDTADAEGYFVKPLIGALTDSSFEVRAAAARALANARVKGDAIKALTLGMVSTLGEKPSRTRPEHELRTLCEEYNNALEKLTGQKRKEADIRKQGGVWMDFWKQNEELIRLADEKLTTTEPRERPKDLPKDSFDQ